MTLQATTWQTVGPFFSIGFEHLDTTVIASPDTAGERVTIEGRVLDGKGQPVPDAVVEIWQANAEGIYPRDSEPTGFRGFGRIPTDEQGRFAFATIKPGRVAGPSGVAQAPHLAVRVMMRGLLKDLVTRMYFPQESLAGDPVLQLVPSERRATLIARRTLDRESTYLWNIVLQGEHETVFFEC
jgi:protocatechuate 3,4-dioxygenase alpha subunit